MKLINAIETGKPFKRLCWAQYYENDFKDLLSNDIKLNNLRFHIEDILADDWMIEQKKVEVTRETINRALNSACHNVDISTKDFAYIMSQLYVKLGL